jgi:hypothetical protein
MNKDIYILKRPTIEIILNKTEETFIVNLISDSKYDETGFEEFLTYFKNTWSFIKEENSIYTLSVVLNSSDNNELPLHAYMKLLKCIADINNTLNTNCHCICIFTSGSKKWQDAYTFITKLWTPTDQRPILFTEDKQERDVFLKSNKLITKKYTP